MKDGGGSLRSLRRESALTSQLIGNKMAASPVQLPGREAAAFKRLMKCYEERQFKQGLKFAKQILGIVKKYRTAQRGLNTKRSMIVFFFGSQETSPIV
jgi:hypothetical protein